MARRRSERARLTNKLDGLCLEIVRHLAKNCCEKCHKYVTGSDSHPSHVIPKGNGASWRRFDLRNIQHLCRACHLYWWHKNTVEADEWFKAGWPHLDKYLDIYKGGKPAKITTPDMRDLAVVLRNKLADLIKETKQ